MSWTPVHRAHYFGCECSPGLTPADKAASNCHNGVGADQAFLDRYCSTDRHRRNGRIITGTATRLAGVKVSVARCVLNYLTQRLPNTDHVTPGWNGTPRPLVVIGKMDGNRDIQRPRCGLCVVDDHLYLWTDAERVPASTDGANGWVPWRQHDGKQSVRFDWKLVCTCQNGAHCTLPKELDGFLKELNEVIGPSKQLDAPVVPRGAYDTDAEDLDEAADDEVFPDRPNKPGQSGTPAAGGSAGAVRRDANVHPVSESVQNAKNGRGMLSVLRCVAIKRMQTNIPMFGSSNLDNLIMATGYPPPASHSHPTLNPHCDMADLLYVMAASLANAAGGQPHWKVFAPAVVQAMRNGGCLTPTNPALLFCAPGAANLENWIACLPPPAGGWPVRMARFVASASAVGAGRTGNPLDMAMLDGMAGFADWILRYHGGSAVSLNTVTAVPASMNHPVVWTALAQLTAYRGIGLAIAANFLKDSQVPPLVAPRTNPRAIAAVTAGWFVKPDLHVIRFVAKLSRGLALHQNGRRQELRVASAALAAPPTNPGAVGYFPGQYGHIPAALHRESRVIADIHAWAGAVKTSALEIERVLYLIGARQVEVPKAGGGSIVVKTSWYRQAEAAIDAAITAGVSPMS